MQFVFDLDGTICFKGKPISGKILDALATLKANGHEVIFASARPIRDMLPVIGKEFHSYTMIGGNGSLISKNGRIFYSTSFGDEDLLAINSLIDSYNVTYLIDGEWNYAYTGPENHPILQNLDPAKLAHNVKLETLTSVVKILILESINNERLLEELTKLNITIHKHGDENVFDLSPNGIDKWSALQQLGVQEGDYVAFGNDANDRTMFENAIHTVMIGYHEQLAPMAKEAIQGEGNVEQAIIEKIHELAGKYNLIKS
ncbi:HAD-IIB family hydrolase [Oceanobacillus chungangensis]|uniref:HAD family hydrolase n=1 Tax=Oceanobacillus chungangensis TaxID=1229152 RepID=A0A3D8PJ48_9BACI|nr:HAD family hydrolase [Oceanobacillus chungangensis]RDW15682.1 HAD family hydrolase [Oceanobacillus chungangensis]